MSKYMEPVPPGEILLEEFMKPLRLSQNRLALALGVPAPTINAIVKNKRRISAEMALRFARYFRTTPNFWMNMQTSYDLEITERSDGATIKKTVHVPPPFTQEQWAHP